MSLRRKIILAIVFSIISCAGAYIIINKIFSNLEAQLMEKCRIEALTGARAMSEIMYFMIGNAMISKDDIFDMNYVEIPGTNPKKYNTKYDRLFDRWIQDIEDGFLLDPDVEFAVLMDKKGYVPTHNRKFSRPTTNNYTQDVHYSRSKRIFSSYKAIQKILAYRGDDTARELYRQDTNEVFWNIGAPVRLYGRQWGTFMIGVNLDRITTIKNQMLALIIITMSVIIAVTNLVILAIIPRRYLPQRKGAGDQNQEAGPSGS